MEFELNFHLGIDVSNYSYYEVLDKYERLEKKLNPKE
jgi:hypothetical protein